MIDIITKSTKERLGLLNNGILSLTRVVDCNISLFEADRIKSKLSQVLTSIGMDII